MSSSGLLFEQLQQDGKRLAAVGKIKESLSKFEEARNIMETPKIVNRIQKLKDALAHSEKESSYVKKSRSSSQKTSQRLDVQKETFRKLNEDPISEEKITGVLSQIDNIKDTQNTHKGKTISNPEELSPENLKKFHELKKSGVEFVVDGKFKEALEAFTEAQILCNCPKITKYIQEVELWISNREGTMQIFKHLSDTGKKLASEGRRTESLKHLKDAFSLFPSPAISKIMKMQEVKEDTSASSKYSSNDDFMSSPVVARKLELGSSNSDDSDFQVVRVKNEKNKSADLSSLSPDRLQQYNNLYEKARVNAASGNLKVAMDALIKAKSICPTDKVLKRIKGLKEHISTSSETEDDKMISVADGFYIFHEIYEKLYPYQREGVTWLWELFKKRKGGVLGDDMGLGKTFQVIAFLSGLIDGEHAKHVLIIMPVSLLTNWENEFQKWSPGISVCLFHGGTKRERDRNILRVQRRGHVLLTSYGMVLNSFENLSNCEGRQFIWDYVILDEGHKIKNPTKTTKAVHNIPAKNRLVLTGTPIQNNLRELWALYDFCHQGTLVGTVKTFKMEYENPITRAREKDATAGQRRLGTDMAENLRMLIEPYFLRRTKAEVWGEPGENADVDDLEQNMDKLRVSMKKVTTRKNDLIIWTFLTKKQCEIYHSFLQSDAVKEILVSTKSPLVYLTTLKKICDHPRLLSQKACDLLGLNGELTEQDLDDETANASSIANVSNDTLIAESGKMNFLISLLQNLKKNGHRTLVFSMSRKILDMVYRILVSRNFKVMRLDGTISKMEERERIIQLFQTDSSYSVFLLTTQVGGVGLTLTAADRVVIYDPSWNPATDAQAVDRAYRIGQQKNIVVYRLITCGTIEEKIYRRQIFKDSITKQVAGATADPSRYFSKQELRELFTLDDPTHSATQVQLSQLHSDQRKTDISLDEHIAYLYNLDIFGISDHDLMFSKDFVDDTEDNDQGAVSHEYIKIQVAAARNMIQKEANIVEEGMRLAGSYIKPYLENIPTFKNNPERDLCKSNSTIEANYPTLSSLPTISDILKMDRTQSHMDSMGASGDHSGISEVIDLCDSPPKSLLVSNYGECKSSPRASRSTKTYEPLSFEEKKVNDYFPVMSKDEANTSRLSGRSSPSNDSVFSQHFSTPTEQSDKNAVDVMFTEEGPKMNRDSPFENSVVASPEATKHSLKEPSTNSLTTEDDVCIIEENVKENIYRAEDDYYTADEDMCNLNSTSTSEVLTRYQPMPTEHVSDHNMSETNEDFFLHENKLDHISFNTKDQSMLEEVASDDNRTNSNKDQSMLEEDASDHNTTNSNKDQSMLEEDASDHNTTNSNADQSMLEEDASDHNTTNSNEDQSMLEEDASDHNTTNSNEDQSMLEEDASDHNTTNSNEDKSMLEDDVLDHNTTSKEDQSILKEDVINPNTTTSKEGQSMLEEDVSDPNTTTSKEDEFIPKEDVSVVNRTGSMEDESILDEYVRDALKEDYSLPDNTSKADHSMIAEYVSDHNTTAASTPGESAACNDQFSFEDNVETVKDGDSLFSTYSKDSLPKSLSNIHLKSYVSPSGPHSKNFPIPNTNSYKQDTSLNPSVKKSDISFDLDSSLYDDERSFKKQPAVFRSSRRSCAIQKTFIDNESDSASNPSSANCSEDEILESDSEVSDTATDLGSPIKEVDSSILLVPSSIPNSPYIAKDHDLTLSPRRRITPLKLRKSFLSPPNSAFALAMATSPLFASVTNSPDISSPPRKKSNSSFKGSFSEEADSPVYIRKTKKLLIVSDSDDSD